MEEFFTRSAANEGVKLPLYLPNGEVTKHHLTVLGIDSDIFRTAEAQAKRTAIGIAQLESKEEREAKIEETERRLVSVLIADWSFDKPCTLENVMVFLLEAPQISDAVNKFAAQRERFMAKKSTSSSDG